MGFVMIDENRARIGGWKDGNDMIYKEYSDPSYMLFKRRFNKGCDKIDAWSTRG